MPPWPRSTEARSERRSSFHIGERLAIDPRGATTARPALQRRPQGSLAAVTAERNELERAKTALRRLGRVVFDAEITGGLKGLIRVDSKDMKPAEVVALAQQTGAI